MCHHRQEEFDLEALSDAEREELIEEHDDAELADLGLDREELTA